MPEEHSADYLEKELEFLFKGVARDLFASVDRTSCPDEPGLILPRCRDGFHLRMSEQEAKQLFLFRLHYDHRYRFSVETPTCEPHGTGRRSGSVDVSLFTSGHQCCVHVEFKEGNDDEGIRTSLEKLIREEKLGGWFHTLADGGSAPNLARNFICSLDTIRHYVEDCEPHRCLFAFCTLRPRLLFLHWLTLGGENSFQDCVYAFRELRLDGSALSFWTPTKLHVEQMETSSTDSPS